MSEGEITLLMRRIREGRDENANAQLWEAYFSRLLPIAKRHLREIPRRASDEEDVAISAFHSFIRAAESGRADGVSNRDELWRLLLTITIRKANRHRERAMAQRRGGGNVAGSESAFHSARENEPHQLVEIQSTEPAPALVAECRERFEALPNELLRRIAAARLSGDQIEDIARSESIAVSTVKRKLKRIRDLWSDV